MTASATSVVTLLIYVTVLLPGEWLVVGTLDPGRSCDLDKVGGRILDPWEERSLHGGEERHSTFFDTVWALTCVRVDLGAVFPLEVHPEATERGGLARCLLPQGLDPGIDLFPDERLLEDARPW